MSTDGNTDINAPTLKILSGQKKDREIRENYNIKKSITG